MNIGRRHITLTGVPNLTTPADIRRAVAKKLQGVENVEIDYNRFRPSGRALITLTRPEYLRDNLRELQKFTLCGIPVRSNGVHISDGVAERPRSRGNKGRAQAAERGAITGNGLHGHFPNAHRNVVMWGLPGRLEPKDLENALHDFKLAKSQKGEMTIVKVAIPHDRFSMFSRFLVTMSSVSEARRLVRQFHMTSWAGGKQLIRAQVLH
ncbi:hypothetical protein DXG03_001163 [Asterophora parasitica]|uniref:RRM domain-containing protein n=1 Tax=Asterophora parasitica TaxID=117018 RepID=A0A9P7KF74_9AGAR|nr:hypothetical protein DXG03_001163 [Asterophora parasitica]